MEPNSLSEDKHSKVRSLPPRARNLKLCVPVVVTVIILLSAAVYHVIHGLKISDKGLERPYFSVVVDCGSTGTRVNVYKWARKTQRERSQLPVLLHSYPDNATRGWKNGCRYHCVQIEPGLDKFAGNFSGIRDSLEPLIRWAELVVPSESHRETPILVLGTAGLRSLSANDAKQVLEDVEDVVKNSGFVYRRSWIRVLSGKEEAYFGWVALNYKMGILDSSSQSVTSLGLLDPGGSSLQLVMEVDALDSEDDRILRSDIGGKRNVLLAVSIPEFGLNEAFDRSVAMLCAAKDQRQEFSGEVRHPCLGSTFVQNFSCSYCLEQKSNSSENGLSMVGSTLSRSVNLVGDPNMELCEKLVKAAALNISISDWSNARTFSSCKGGLSTRDGMTALGIRIKPVPDLRFHALSGFFAVYTLLDLPAGASMTEIWTKAHQLCSRIWADAKIISDNQHPAPQYCFKVLYMVSLITDALCLGDSEIIFGPGDVSWTLGASLVQQEQSLDTKSREILTGMFSIKYQQVVFSPLTLLFLLLLALYGVYRYQVKLPMPQRRSVAPAAVLPSYNHFIHRPH